MGARAVRGGLDLWGDAGHVSSAAAQEKSPASPESEGVGGGAGGLEKRGLRTQRDTAGLTTVRGLAWADEMRVGLIGQTRRVWASVGVKIVQAVEYVYQWQSLVLAVNGLSGRLWWDWTSGMTSQQLAGVVAQWSRQGLSSVVWDRARGHGGAVYEAIPVQRIEQPAYSPELNPAERVFEWLRSRIEGVVYGTLEAKRAAVERELCELNASPERIQRLAGWTWIRDALIGLPE